MTENSNGQSEVGEVVKESFIELVDISEYLVPDKMLELKLNVGLRDMINNFFSTEEKDEEYQPFDQLNAFSSGQIEKIAPKPDWYQAQQSLETILPDETETDEQIRLAIISKPNSGTVEIIKDYISNHEYVLQEPPTYDQILDYTPGDDVPIDVDCNIAILNLENWFLRYFPGLDFIERVMEILANHEHSIILVCHSWTWKFITTILKIPTSEYSIKMFQALQHDKLEQWLVNLSVDTHKRKLLYRMADSGKLVSKYQLDIVEELKQENESNSGNEVIFQIDDKYMKKLAGYSLGLPKTCWHIWRHSLRRQPDDSMQIEEQDGEQQLKPYTIWVLPWEQISIPELSKNITRDEKMILYAIVLHNGLPIDIIHRILDIERYHLKAHIERLDKAGIIYLSKGWYHISSNVYPKVRRLLEGTSFVIDDLEVN